MSCTFDFTEEQILNALKKASWNSNQSEPLPLLNAYCKISIQIFIYLIVFAVFFCVLSSKDSFAETISVPVFELVYSTRGETNFTIQVYADGKVHYQGNKVLVKGELHQLVAVIGDQYAQLSPKQVDELSVKFLSLPFKLTKKYEHKSGNETATHSIKYLSPTVEIIMNDPLFSSAFARELNKLIDIKKWICFPRDNSANSSCLISDIEIDYFRDFEEIE